MKRSRIVFLPCSALALWATAEADSIPFTCAAPEPGSAYGVSAQIGRQTVGLSGVIGMNCCASQAYTHSLDSGRLLVVIDNRAYCKCAEMPCAFAFQIDLDTAIVSRVVVHDNFGGPLLDTALTTSVRAGMGARRPDARRSVTAPVLYDLRGAAMRVSDSRLGLRAARAGPGVCLARVRGRGVTPAVVVQP